MCGDHTEGLPRSRRIIFGIEYYVEKGWSHGGILTWTSSHGVHIQTAANCSTCATGVDRYLHSVHANGLRR